MIETNLLLSKAAVLATDVILVEENRTLYLIPPSHPPIRLNKPGTRLYRRIISTATLSDAITQHAIAENIDVHDAAQEIISFVATLTDSGCMSLVTKPASHEAS